MKNIFKAIFCTNLPKRDIKNANRVNFLALLWALSLALITFAFKKNLIESNLLIGLTFLLHTAIGIFMVLSFKHMLKELDEMEKKIQLDALALSVGTTIICFSSYSLLAKANILPPLNSAYLIMLMALTYVAGIMIGRVRYS